MRIGKYQPIFIHKSQKLVGIREYLPILEKNTFATLQCEESGTEVSVNTDLLCLNNYVIVEKTMH